MEFTYIKASIISRLLSIVVDMVVAIIPAAFGIAYQAAFGIAYIDFYLLWWSIYTFGVLITNIISEHLSIGDIPFQLVLRQSNGTVVHSIKRMFRALYVPMILFPIVISSSFLWFFIALVFSFLVLTPHFFKHKGEQSLGNLLDRLMGCLLFQRMRS